MDKTSKSAHRWIDDDIVLDFPFTSELKGLISEAEEADVKGSEEFSCIAYAIDVLGKQYYVSGRISKEQWDALCNKYPVV